jgi:hypothetical protein
MIINACRFKRIVLPNTSSRVAPKPRLPHAVADNHNWVATLVVPFLFGQTRAAQQGLDVQHIEVVSRDKFRPGTFRFSVGTDAQRCESPEGGSGDQPQIVPVVAVVEVRRVDDIFRWGHGLYEGEFLRCAGTGEGVQQGRN